MASLLEPVFLARRVGWAVLRFSLTDSLSPGRLRSLVAVSSTPAREARPGESQEPAPVPVAGGLLSTQQQQAAGQAGTGCLRGSPSGPSSRGSGPLLHTSVSWALAFQSPSR